MMRRRRSRRQDGNNVGGSEGRGAPLKGHNKRLALRSQAVT